MNWLRSALGPLAILAGVVVALAVSPASTTESSRIRWTGSVAVVTGPGRVGPWRMNRSDWHYVDDPTVALDREGEAAVAWVDQARKDVLFQRYGPDGKPRLAEPVNVSRSPAVFSWLPRMAMASEGQRIYLLWQEIVFSGGTHGGEAFFARSTDGGRTWDEPINLSRTEAGVAKGRLSPERWHNGSLDLALGPEGTLYAAWTVYEGGLFVARSESGGARFTEATRVSTETDEPARGPALAVSPRGTVHLTWAVGEDPEADLRYATSEDGARSFDGPRILFPSPRHTDAPTLAVGMDGTVHLAYAAGPWDERAYHIRYARAPAGGDGFGPAHALPALPKEGYVGARFPSLALDGEGNPYLIWELYRQGQVRSRGLGFTHSADGGRSFAQPVLVPGTADPAFQMNGSLQGLLMDKLAVNARGELAVVNSAFQPGEGSRIRLLRGRTGDR